MSRVQVTPGSEVIVENLSGRTKLSYGGNYYLELSQSAKISLLGKEFETHWWEYPSECRMKGMQIGTWKIRHLCCGFCLMKPIASSLTSSQYNWKKAMRNWGSNEDLEVDPIILLAEEFADHFKSSERAHNGWLKHWWFQVKDWVQAVPDFSINTARGCFDQKKRMHGFSVNNRKFLQKKAATRPDLGQT